MSRRNVPKVDDQLRVEMRDFGLNLSQVAQATGIDPSRLSRFLRAERTLTLPAVVKLCAFLGMSLTAPMRETMVEADAELKE